MHRPRAVPRSAHLADGRSIHYFDDVRPEEAAERLRQAAGRSPH